MFFQAALVAGYGVAHLSLRALGVRRHAIFQVALVAVALIALPIAVPAWTRSPDGAPTALWLVLVLTAAVGFPFVALATNGPTMQRWYADLPVAGAAQPYRLFAASNAGSLVGLIAYPTLVEPNLDLPDQARWWAVGYVAFVGLSVACAVVLRRYGPQGGSPSDRGATRPPRPAAPRHPLSPMILPTSRSPPAAEPAGSSWPACRPRCWSV